MAMNVGSGSGGDPEVMVDINTTPLIDVMLVLLIMLIITIPIQTHAVKLNMPVGNPPPPPTPPEVVLMEIDFDGTLLWNGEQIDLGTLDQRLRGDAVAGKTANESFSITRMRGSVATASGDMDTANKAFESVLNSGKVSGRDALQMIQAIAVNHYKAKDYAKAAQWTQRYFKEGGTDGAMRTVLLQSYYLGNDCNSVNKMLGNGAEDRKSSEEELQILANCYLRQKDTAGYVGAIEKLVVHYPKKEYWTDLLSRVQKKPGFSDRLSLHVYRLRLATGNLSGTNDYMEMAQLALQAGVPAEAKTVVDKGYEVKALGTGKEADRHQPLPHLLTKTLPELQKTRPKDDQP